MAKVLNIIFVRRLSGKLGDQVVFRTLRDGRTVVCNVPDFSNRKLSRDHKQHRKRFQAASAYAKSPSRSQQIYAKLAAGTMKNAYNVALGDWFHPPVIHRVERRGWAIALSIIDGSNEGQKPILALPLGPPPIHNPHPAVGGCYTEQQILQKRRWSKDNRVMVQE